MYFIALCDDEEKELALIEDMLASYQRKNKELEYKTERFVSAEGLLSQIGKGYTPDFLFLDIFMSGKSGIEAAQEIRNMGYSMPIVFLTTSREYALQAYEVDAIQYLVKPLDRERFFHAIDSAVIFAKKIKQRQIIFKVSGGIRQIQSNDIIYCESQKNYQILYLTAEKHKVRMTAGSLWEILESFPQFGRCGRSYILNMNHIVSVEREEIAMDNGSIIYIPRYKAAEFKKIYFSYYFDNKEEAKAFSQEPNR